MKSPETAQAGNAAQRHLTVPAAVEIIRMRRNELLTFYLRSEILPVYVFQRFRTELSPNSLSLAKRELGDLLISPVDLVHYSRLIMGMCRGDAFADTASNHQLFYDELDNRLGKFRF